MSGALAITSVTTVLKSLLSNALIQAVGMGDVTITSVPPDRIATGAEEHPLLNIHLYRLTPNSAWRHANTPAAPKEAQQMMPLALDLHYLLTVYGEQDHQAEILLGHAIQCFYETSILTREALLSSLASISSSSGGGPTFIPSSLPDLTKQPEQIKISQRLRPTALLLAQQPKILHHAGGRI